MLIRATKGTRQAVRVGDALGRAPLDGKAKDNGRKETGRSNRQGP